MQPQPSDDSATQTAVSKGAITEWRENNYNCKQSNSD
jgi:hypothetical protein